MLSVGSILMLAFFTAIIVYIVVGILYKKAVYGCAGLDCIPNIVFWTSLPGLIKDGYMFFLSPCLGERIQYRPYQQIDTVS